MNTSKNLNGFRYYRGEVSDEVKAADTLNISSSGSLTSNTNSATTETYRTKDSLGNCYSRSIASAAQVLTSVVDGRGCQVGRDGDDGDR